MSATDTTVGVIPRPSSLATSYAQNYLSHPGLDWVEPLNTFLPHEEAEDVIQAM
jgi:hypothetical protein